MSNNKDNKIHEEEYRPIVWNYFKLHANQRITLFRFYIIFFSLFAVVIGHLVSEFHFLPTYQEWIVVVLSIVFILITIIFWCLDNRNRYLIHNSEKYFEKYEEKFSNNETLEKNRFVDQINRACIFTIEKKDKNDGKCMFRHSHCFMIIYGIGFLLAIVFIFIAAYSMCHHDDDTYYQIKFINQIEKHP